MSSVTKTCVYCELERFLMEFGWSQGNILCLYHERWSGQVVKKKKCFASQLHHVSVVGRSSLQEEDQTRDPELSHIRGPTTSLTEHQPSITQSHNI